MASATACTSAVVLPAGKLCNAELSLRNKLSGSRITAAIPRLSSCTRQNVCRTDQSKSNAGSVRTGLTLRSNVLGESGSLLRLKRPSCSIFPQARKNAITKSMADDAVTEKATETKSVLESFTEKYPTAITGFFFFMWYFLNVIFNIMNKKIYNYFPYPYFVSVIHLVVGVAYCLVSWAVGFPKRAPIDKDLWLLLAPVAFCHALGHVLTNVSFAAVAVSFTHTIKALEPFFNAAASQFIMGQPVSLPLWFSLMPVVFGVSLASMTELSFNWLGFLTAMSSNIAFTYRNIFSKKAMVGMDSTNVYAYISILALAFCIPPAIAMEGPQLLKFGFADAIAKVGMQKFVSDLFWVGMFYHLYNQLATNTLERVAPLTHAVGNVLKRVFVIGFSIIVFGNRISGQTGVGTAIAIGGVALYSFLKASAEEAKRKVVVSVENLPSGDVKVEIEGEGVDIEIQKPKLT